MLETLGTVEWKAFTATTLASLLARLYDLGLVGRLVYLICDAPA